MFFAGAEVGIKGVKRGLELVVRAPLDAAEFRFAGFEIGGGEEFRAAEQGIAVGVGREAPGLILLFLLRRGQLRCAKRNADRVIGELVDIDERGAIALIGDVRRFFGVGVRFAAQGQVQDPMALGQRAYGHHVDRAGEALADQVGGRGLDHVAAIHKFRRDLVVLESAVVRNGGDFATIEQGSGEIRSKAANREHVSPTGQTLGGHAWQLRQGFSDGGVGQLADIFRRDRFDDRGRFFFDLDGFLHRLAIAGDDHGRNGIVGGGRGRSGGRGGFGAGGGDQFGISGMSGAGDGSRQGEADHAETGAARKAHSGAFLANLASRIH